MTASEFRAWPGLLQGRGEPLATEEAEGQMIQRVMPSLMGVKNILALNDAAHHCYREKPPDEDEEGVTTDLKGEDRAEAERNNEAARLWISGLEAVKRKLGIQRVIDLSATPFFLRGSGDAEGTLFPWTMSDFSLMDAIECGIVKLPRVPVADNIAGDEMPIRCVVSVSMLTEGWDANTVTHVLSVRAFGTQLLCEQVTGRALRRQSYELNEENLFNVEYADVLGIRSISRQSLWSRLPGSRPRLSVCEPCGPRVISWRSASLA